MVQTLAEKYPEIRGMRNEMVSTISQELSVEGSTESSGDFETGERLLSSGGSEFEPRTELEKIVALENYMEWRKDTMTRRQANKAKGIVDEIVRLPPPALLRCAHSCFAPLLTRSTRRISRERTAQRVR